MSPAKPQPPSDAPHGTEPRRPAWPLVAWIMLFAVCCAFALWMAVRYPAR